jgi:hypothetical protein
MADLLTNFSLDVGDCKCHSLLDLRVSATGDLALTRDPQQALRQRFLIYLATPKGERLNPNIGCSLHDFTHELNVPNISRKLELYIENDLKTQFPELKVRNVRCSPSSYIGGAMEMTVIFADNNLQFLFTSDDLLNLSSMIAELIYYTT